MVYIFELTPDEFYSALRLIEFGRTKHSLARNEVENIRRARDSLPKTRELPKTETLSTTKIEAVRNALAQIIQNPLGLGTLGVDDGMARALEGARKRILANRLPGLGKRRIGGNGGSSGNPPIENRQYRVTPSSRSGGARRTTYGRRR